MRPSRSVTLGLALTAVAGSASAKETLRLEPTRVAVASSVIREQAAASLGLLGSDRREARRTTADPEIVLSVAQATPLAGGDETRAALSLQAESRDREPSSCTSGCGYRSLLSSLFIARDMLIPGAEGMGLRLIPTKTALAGESAPVVLRPRFVGTSLVGMDVAASF